MTDTKLKAYIDRILRSRVREDDEKANTKEIYKELAGEGYDKTIVGKVVNHLRKDESKAQEQSEKFDLYLTAYLGASHVHARVREDDEREVPVSVAAAGASPALISIAAAQAANANEEDEDVAPSPAHAPEQPGSDHGSVSTPDEGGADSSQIHEPEAAMLPQTGGVTLVANSEPLVFDPADAPSGAATRKDAGTAAPNPITDLTQPNPICRDPGDCGVYASWHHPCLACKRAASVRAAA